VGLVARIWVAMPQIRTDRRKVSCTNSYSSITAAAPAFPPAVIARLQLHPTLRCSSSTSQVLPTPAASRTVINNQAETPQTLHSHALHHLKLHHPAVHHTGSSGDQPRADGAQLRDRCSLHHHHRHTHTCDRLVPQPPPHHSAALPRGRAHAGPVPAAGRGLCWPHLLCVQP
jgi:hypothetical protein